MFSAVGLFFEGLIRDLFFFIDQAVYWLIESAYNVILELSEVSLLGAEEIDKFASRIYTFLGIIMLFKVGVSLINYFLNPDSFNDSKSGMGSVLKRIIISCILIIVVPIIFTQAFKLQKIILKNNILPSIVFGDTGGSEVINGVENAGKLISMQIFKSLFRPKLDADGNEFQDGSDIYQNEDVKNGLSDLSPLLKMEKDNQFVYEYKLPLTTIVGALAAWILVMYCFDIGVRAVKLSFLQLMAPIPIISYIDPKKGDSIFKKWTSSCVSTYLSVFLRLILLYFVMYIFTYLSYNDWAPFDVVAGESATVGGVTKLFIILGLLLFLKEGPALISDIFGIKMDGGFTFNPMEKIGASPVAAAAVGGTIAATGGVAANITSGIKNKDGFLKTAGSAIAGGASAGSRAVVAGLSGGGKASPMALALNGIAASNAARYNRSVAQKSDYGVGERALDRWYSFAGVKNKEQGVGYYDDQMKKLARGMDDARGQEQALLDARAKFAIESNVPSEFFERFGEPGTKFYDNLQDYQRAEMERKYGADYDKQLDEGTLKYEKALEDLDLLTEEQFNATKKDIEKYQSFSSGIKKYNEQYAALEKQYKAAKNVYESQNPKHKK